MIELVHNYKKVWSMYTLASLLNKTASSGKDDIRLHLYVHEDDWDEAPREWILDNFPNVKIYQSFWRTDNLAKTICHLKSYYTGKDKQLNKIAALEKAISEKYGEEAIVNPKSNWDDSKEQDYLQQMRAMYKKQNKANDSNEKIDLNGIKVAKKLLNRESLKSCPVCGSFPRKSMDDVCLVKFECCSSCYDRYILGREERWLKGWRPNNGNSI